MCVDVHWGGHRKPVFVFQTKFRPWKDGGDILLQNIDESLETLVLPFDSRHWLVYRKQIVENIVRKHTHRHTKQAGVSNGLYLDLSYSVLPYKILNLIKNCKVCQPLISTIISFKA